MSRTGAPGRRVDFTPEPLVECATVRAKGHCELEQLLGVVGDRWSLQVVTALLRGPLRTTELVSALAPVSTRTLADRLKRLETAGVLSRQAFAEAPPRVEYSLTERGLSLETAIAALRQAAISWSEAGCNGSPCNACDGAGHSREPSPKASEAARVTSAPVDVTLL